MIPMKNFIKNFVLFFGALCLVHVIIELPYNLYIGEEFDLPQRSIIYYLIFSTIYALFKQFRSQHDKG